MHAASQPDAPCHCLHAADGLLMMALPPVPAAVQPRLDIAEISAMDEMNPYRVRSSTDSSPPQQRQQASRACT